MTFIARQEPFVCEHCGVPVEPLPKGTYRDHCPSCLYSQHVDDRGPGDRLSECRGLMEPTGIETDAKRGLMIVYLCTLCGKVSRNKAAPDDEILAFAQTHPSPLP